MTEFRSRGRARPTPSARAARLARHRRPGTTTGCTATIVPPPSGEAVFRRRARTPGLARRGASRDPGRPRSRDRDARLRVGLRRGTRVRRRAPGRARLRRSRRAAEPRRDVLHQRPATGVVRGASGCSTSTPARCAKFGFDGIHMDTYGPPHRARQPRRRSRSTSPRSIPGLIAEGARTVGRTPGRPQVLFNCVEGFPLEHVARAPAAALYLELWPPDVGLPRHRRAGSTERERSARDERWSSRRTSRPFGRTNKTLLAVPARSEAAVLLTTRDRRSRGATTTCSPSATACSSRATTRRPARSTPANATELRAAWVFTARYLHLLSDPALHSEPLDAASVRVSDADGAAIPTNRRPVRRERVGARDATARWHLCSPARRPPRAGRRSLGRRAPAQFPTNRMALRWDGGGSMPPCRDVAVDGAGDARRLVAAAAVEWRVPPFRRWLVVVRPPG